MMRIDLNCDMGESPDAVFDGTQEALMAFVTSVNIACGGHAGDDLTMEATIRQAMRNHVAVGAHPGYADRENFGRLEMQLSFEEIADVVYGQVVRFARIAEICGAPVVHVKPHGALYNQAVKDAAISAAIAEGVKRWNPGVILVGLAGSQMLEVFRSVGCKAAAEAFADRRYEADGTLRNRRFADALIGGPQEAAEQACQIARDGVSQTICIHSDTPGSVQIAQAVAAALTQAGVCLQNLG